MKVQGEVATACIREVQLLVEMCERAAECRARGHAVDRKMQAMTDALMDHAIQILRLPRVHPLRGRVVEISIDEALDAGAEVQAFWRSQHEKLFSEVRRLEANTGVGFVDRNLDFGRAVNTYVDNVPILAAVQAAFERRRVELGL